MPFFVAKGLLTATKFWRPILTALAIIVFLILMIPGAIVSIFIPSVEEDQIMKYAEVANKANLNPEELIAFDMARYDNDFSKANPNETALHFLIVDYERFETRVRCVARELDENNNSVCVEEEQYQVTIESGVLDSKKAILVKLGQWGYYGEDHAIDHLIMLNGTGNYSIMMSNKGIDAAMDQAKFSNDQKEFVKELLESGILRELFPQLIISGGAASGLHGYLAFKAYYEKAAERYGVDWFILAAVHHKETTFSTHPSMQSTAGALGHMQFMPCTWVGWSHPTCGGLGRGSIPQNDLVSLPTISRYGGLGTDGSGNGKADPFDIQDAIHTAAKYLGSMSYQKNNTTSIKEALRRYNGSGAAARAYAEDVYKNGQLIKQIDEGQTIIVGANDWAWPTTSTRVTSKYGPRNCTGCSSFHKGWDVGATKQGVAGDPIFSLDNGVVIVSTYSNSGGNMVVIDHGGGISSRYLHMHTSPYVRVGQRVDRGQTIGIMGNTGNSFGVHLHFEILNHGRAVDPANYFKGF